MFETMCEELNKSLKTLLSEAGESLKADSKDYVEITNLHLTLVPVDAPNHEALLKHQDFDVKCKKVIPFVNFNQDEVKQVINEILEENDLVEYDFEEINIDPPYIENGKICVMVDMVAYNLQNKFEFPYDEKNGHLWVNLSIVADCVHCTEVTDFNGGI